MALLFSFEYLVDSDVEKTMDQVAFWVCEWICQPSLLTGNKNKQKLKRREGPPKILIYIGVNLISSKRKR